MQKLKMHSPDMTQDHIARIRELFPNCVTEAQNADGSLRLSVDFDALRQELSGSIVGEYGVGYAKTDYYKQSIGPEAYSRLSARKAAFDPKHILNPGKVVI